MVIQMAVNSRNSLLITLFILLLLSLLYPAGFEINYIKPDFILVFVILTALLYDFKDIVYITVISGLVRDLVEFRFPGPYVLIYFILVVVVYFCGSFFYRPGIMINIAFIAAFTLLHDVIWVLLYNAYYLFRFSMITDLALLDTLRYGTVYHMFQNIVFGMILYYVFIFLRRRTADEKR